MSKLKNLKQRCFFDVSIENQNVGRIIFELFNDICPITCENFKSLCTGERGIGEKTKKPLHYKGVPFHRIIHNFMIQSGDFSLGNGKGGESIYGRNFEDENFHHKHDRPYLLSMANKGKDTNGSQFFITLVPTPHLDGVHVVFGHVISGHEVIEKIASLPVDKNARPNVECSIANCGQLIPQLKEKDDKQKKDKKKKNKKDRKERRKKAKKNKHGGDSTSSSSSSSSDDSNSSSDNSSSSDSEDEEEHSSKRKKINIDSKSEIESMKDADNEEEEEGEIRDQTPMNNPAKTTTIERIRDSESPQPWAPKVYSSKFKPDEIPDVPQNRFLSREPRPKQKIEVEEELTPETKEKKKNKNKKNKDDDKNDKDNKNKDKSMKEESESEKAKDEFDGKNLDKYERSDERRHNNDRRYDDYKRYDEDRRYSNGDRRHNNYRKYRDDPYDRDYRSSRSSYRDRNGKKIKGRGKFMFRRSITPPHWRSEATKSLNEALGKTETKPVEEREVTLCFDTIYRKRNVSHSRSRSKSPIIRKSKQSRNSRSHSKSPSIKKSGHSRDSVSRSNSPVERRSKWAREKESRNRSCSRSRSRSRSRDNRENGKRKIEELSSKNGHSKLY